LRGGALLSNFRTIDRETGYLAAAVGG